MRWLALVLCACAPVDAPSPADPSTQAFTGFAPVALHLRGDDPIVMGIWPAQMGPPPFVPFDLSSPATAPLLNGHAGYHFDATSGLILADPFVSEPSEAHVFAVIDADDGRVANGFPFDFGGGSSAPGWPAYLALNGRTLVTFGYAPRMDIPIPDGLEDATVLAVAAGGADVQRFRLDGVEVGSNTGGTLNFDMFALGTRSVGRGAYGLTAGPGIAYHGDLYEVVLIEGALDTPQRNRIFSYLALKHGLTLASWDLLEGPAGQLIPAEICPLQRETIGIGRD
ncbi:MAG: hypothetical protein KC656_09370, partial [Myxococcales bacterium]|nr:hypothetical protein [Myxococcales bacterium]